MTSKPYEEDNWQATRDTVRDRNKFMYNNPLLSDVKFVVGDARHEQCGKKVTIPAHKYVLAISNPVFFAMLYGELAETGDTIEFTDCDSEGFSELLRYVYCDELSLTGNSVMQVLYLAKKFIIPSLVKKCTEFLEHNVDVDNVFSVLPQAKKFDEAQLVSQCWEVLDLRSTEAVNSASFENIDKELLLEFVERDTLSVKEVDLFKAVQRWAVSECQRRRVKDCGNRKREVLGKALELIRFPLMSQEEFADIVLSADVLNLEEVVAMFRYFSMRIIHTNELMFSNKQRSQEFECRKVRMLQCNRFVRLGVSWGYGTFGPDAIIFSTNSPIVFWGFRLFGNQNSQYTSKIKVYNDSQEVIWSREETYVATVEECGYYGYNIMFDNGIQLEANTPCTIEVLINGPNSVSGKGGQTTALCENVTFTYVTTQKSANGTSAREGQFPVLFFRKLPNNHS